MYSFKKPSLVTWRRVEQCNAEEVEQEELLMFWSMNKETGISRSWVYKCDSKEAFLKL